MDVEPILLEIILIVVVIIAFGLWSLKDRVKRIEEKLDSIIKQLKKQKK
jgi:hypothetical protein